MNKYLIIFVVLAFGGCVEPYDFNVDNVSDGIVIEASISDKSFSETLAYPSDGRYFKVKLGKTSDVTNVRDQKISGAIVELVQESGGSWHYDENPEITGEYILYDKNFNAVSDARYRLEIELASGEKFESAWEELPALTTTMGAVTFEESVLEKYVYKAAEKVLDELDGVIVSTKVPKNESNEPAYYRWDFEPLWVYIAPNHRLDPAIKTCWVTSPYYLKAYTLQKDLAGNYNKELFFIETNGNERVYKYFSVLITQTRVSETYYYFWEDLQAQGEKGGLFDQPPYGLITNFKALNNDWTVNGYFGVVAEAGTRWVLDKSQLSYPIVDNLYELCQISYGPGPPGGPECFNCLLYSKGDATNVPPLWW